MNGSSVNGTCLVIPCQNAGLCSASSGACICPFGLYGTFCEGVWIVGYESAFQAWRWTFIALFILLAVLCILLVLEFWYRKVVVRKVSQEQGGIIFAFFASVFALLYLGIDPFRLQAALRGEITIGLRIGVGIIGNLTLACIANGWSLIMIVWWRIRSPFMGERGRRGVNLLWILSFGTLLMAVVFGVLLPWLGNTADIIFYVYLGVVAVIVGVVIFVSAILTYKQLGRFPERHKGKPSICVDGSNLTSLTLGRMTRLSMHMVACGTVILLAILILIIIAAAPLNSSFLGFYIGRCWISYSIQFLSTFTIPLLLRYRGWKKSGETQTSDPNTSDPKPELQVAEL